ncbi:MAG TPA: hypothetical protein VK335_26630 [Bryobacteraceae bacterium]|nr:hypothetical protein [Bryobacteraceae bacterium]
MDPFESTCGIFANEEHFAGFLKAFEHGTWPKADWNHDAHLTVAGCYLFDYPLEVATDRMRLGIRHYNHCVGTRNTDHSGYHETLTVFWMAIVKQRLAQLPLKTPRLEAVRTVVEELGPRRDLFKEYYGIDVVKSVEARRAWVEPDLKALP